MADINDIVEVTVQLAAPGTPRTEFGRTLLLTRDDSVLDAAGAGKVSRYARYRDMTDAGFDTSVLSAAEVYFGQDPAPRDLLVGRRTTVDTDHEVRGGTPAVIGTIAALSSSGSFSFNGESFTGADFSSDASFADAASGLETVLQANPAAWATTTGYNVGDRVRQGSTNYVCRRAHTAGAASTDIPDGSPDQPSQTGWRLGADYSSASVAYQATPGRFVVTVPRAQDVSGVFSAHPQGTGNDASGPLGLTADDGATFHRGGAAETVSEALSNIQFLDSSFTQLVLDPLQDGSQDMLDASGWAQANQVMFFAASSETAALTAAETGSFAARLFAMSPRYSAGVYSESADGKAASLAAFFSSVNFDAGGSLRTANLADLPSTEDDNFTATQEGELERKNWNYTGYQGRLHDGRLLNGEWIDSRLWTRWFQNELQTSVYNLLVNGRIPQTNAGLQAVKDAITTVCELGVINGGIANTGAAPAAMKGEIQRETRNPEFDGILSKGYLVYVPSIASQTVTQRNARQAPAFRIWAIGSGFLHGVSISVTFQP